MPFRQTQQQEEETEREGETKKGEKQTQRNLNPDAGMKKAHVGLGRCVSAYLI